MCNHHKPALKLQRVALYVLAGLFVLASQYL